MLPGDLKIVLTVLGGIAALALLIYWLGSKPLVHPSDDYEAEFDRAPERPEDETRKTPF